jgi:hypothetical protein
MSQPHVLEIEDLRTHVPAHLHIELVQILETLASLQPATRPRVVSQAFLRCMFVISLAPLLGDASSPPDGAIRTNNQNNKELTPPPVDLV